MMNPKNTRYPNPVGAFPIAEGTFSSELKKAFDTLNAKTGPGCEMLGWTSWPEEYFSSEEYKRLKETADRIRNESNSVVVIGIGGSYLTPQMVIQSQYGEFYNEAALSCYGGDEDPMIYFAGCDLSPNRLQRILELLENDEWSIIYISKSGGTIEPALAFHTFWDALYTQYGEEAHQRVYAVTDSEKGILKGMANQYGWESFVIPDNIGGRYSAFTACGLLPLAVAGIDTDELLCGAIEASHNEMQPNSFAGQYASWRYAMYKAGFKVEFLATNTPDLAYFTEWLKQLFGESEGKDYKGLFPASGVFPRDLHSLGQFLQEGSRNVIFETFLERDFSNDLEIPNVSLADNLDRFVGKNFSQAAAAAMDGALQAHTAGGNPCGKVCFGNSLKNLGYLMFAFLVSCPVYCHMIGVNPFNQPGVEKHKAIMKTSPAWD